MLLFFLHYPEHKAHGDNMTARAPAIRYMFPATRKKKRNKYEINNYLHLGGHLFPEIDAGNRSHFLVGVYISTSNITSNLKKNW